jgi:hypothetical protein
LIFVTDHAGFTASTDRLSTLLAPRAYRSSSLASLFSTLSAIGAS